MPAGRREVRWSAAARGDLREIIRRIAADRPIAARTVLRRLRERAESIRTSPARGRIVPELRRRGIVGFRELLVPPWRILYQSDPERVDVLAVIDGRRSVEDLLLWRIALPRRD